MLGNRLYVFVIEYIGANRRGWVVTPTQQPVAGEAPSDMPVGWINARKTVV